MDDSQAALILFFGLSWANAVSASTEYRAFDTAKLLYLKQIGRAVRSFARFIVGNLICNALPITLLYICYTKVFVDANGGALPFSAKAMIATAIASTSVFCVPRLMHSFLATWPLHYLFYNQSELNDILIHTGQAETNNFFAHFIPGIGYAIGAIYIATLFL